MAPVSAGAERMNQFLQDRRKKINQNKKFRKQRILKQYRKAQQDYNKSIESKLLPSQQFPNNQQIQPNPEIQRKISFYNQVFNETHVNERLNKNKKKNKKNKNKFQDQSHIQEKDEKTLLEQKLENLKQKKVKFIKKMNQQKTAKGQPVMRNMISYALTKIQETINRQKLQKLSQNVKQKNQPTKKSNLTNK